MRRQPVHSAYKSSFLVALFSSLQQQEQLQQHPKQVTPSWKTGIG